MKTSCTKIEFATIPDATEIAELSRKHIEYQLGWHYSPSRIREIIGSPSKNAVVARENGTLTGFGIMTYLEDSANLDLLTVKSRYRRRGVGRRIVSWLEQVADIAGIASIFVQVRKRNGGAIRFYQRLGFQIIEEIAGYYQGRESAVIMCKGIGKMFGRDSGFDATRYYR